MSKLVAHRYGKARVRVLKILREGDVHRLKDIEAMVLLQGDFETSYTSGDNSKVVATDSIKNTINILAKEKLGDEIERFAIVLGEHFLKRYVQVHAVEVEIVEKNWQRMDVAGKPHPHSFVARSGACTFTRVVISRMQMFL